MLFCSACVIFCHCIGIPHCLLDYEINFRLENYARCLEILNKELKSVTVAEEKNMLMKSLGVASFSLYACKRNTSEKSVTSFEHAKQAASCLGTAYDNSGISDESPEVEMLDITMNDIIANQNQSYLKLKPLIRCLLCKMKCQKGKKLIRSHIWPNSCLRAFTQYATTVPASMKIFDSTHMNYGTLLGPSQISYPMLCQKCENNISIFENLFKSNFFDVVHDLKFEYACNPDEIRINLDSNWLFLFCVSIIFRVSGVVSGFMRRYGNYEEIYQLFMNCRKVLLNEASADILIKLKIAIFLTPVHEILKKSDVSPALQNIIFSKGAGAWSTFTLNSGVRLHDKVDFLWSSIGNINIVAGVSKNCFKLISPESVVTSGQKLFIIPSALQRHLIFPKGIFREFEYLASKRTNRVLNASRVPKFKPEWMSEEFSSFEEQACSEIANLNLEVAADRDEYKVINYLPSPFNCLRRNFDVKDITPAKVVIHSTSMNENATIITSAFLLIMTNDYSACALMQICWKSYIIWTGYSLSVEDYSIRELLPCKNKKILGVIEMKFKTKSAITKELHSVLLRTGFTSIAHLAQWMQISW